MTFCKLLLIKYIGATSLQGTKQSINNGLYAEVASFLAMTKKIKFCSNWKSCTESAWFQLTMRPMKTTIANPF